MLPFTSITSIKRNKSIAIKKGKEVLADRSYWKTESNAYRYIEPRPGNGPVRRPQEKHAGSSGVKGRGRFVKNGGKQYGYQPCQYILFLLNEGLWLTVNQGFASSKMMIGKVAGTLGL